MVRVRLRDASLRLALERLDGFGAMSEAAEQKLLPIRQIRFRLMEFLGTGRALIISTRHQHFTVHVAHVGILAKPLRPLFLAPETLFDKSFCITARPLNGAAHSDQQVPFIASSLFFSQPKQKHHVYPRSHHSKPHHNSKLKAHHPKPPHHQSSTLKPPSAYLIPNPKFSHATDKSSDNISVTTVDLDHSSTLNPVYEYSEEINAQAEKAFNERRGHLWEVCERNKIVGKFAPNAWEFFISPGHGLAWCNVFKAASTTWMYYFNVLGWLKLKN